MQVGCVIKVRNNEFFPCDMILLKSSLPKGICYVETKGLDGETNLKHKQVDKRLVTNECESEGKNDSLFME
jgi:phospholipid-transporting ATPase